MQVLLEPTTQGVRATLLGRDSISAEGRDDKEALGRLQEVFTAQLPAGARVIDWPGTPQSHPLARFAGMFRDNPAFEDWQESIAQRRQELDESK